MKAKLPAKRTIPEKTQILHWMARAACLYALEYLDRPYNEGYPNPSNKHVQAEVVDEAALHFDDFVVSTRDRLAKLEQMGQAELTKAELLMCARDFGRMVGEEIRKRHCG